MVLLDKKNVERALADALAQKGEKKFVQSVDLAINFQDVDFKKQEGRINLEVVLPFEPKPTRVCVFADGQVGLDAKKAGADLVVSSAEIDSYAKDKKKLTELLNYSLLAVPQLMVPVGKALGKTLGAKGKTPKPMPPNANMASLISNSRRTMVLKAKGKFLPCVHCLVGKENMDKAQIVENILAIIAAMERQGFDKNVKSVFIKTTMGKPVKLGVAVKAA
ncbi:MAG TPA: hypothetical protein VI875_01825 [Candidatus Norongarragalinales archaeon]|nr:hypothetical protein [Candidatus Norongarragalinales archaeon]